MQCIASWLLTVLFLFLTHIFVSVLLATNEPRPRVVVSGRVRLLWVHISLHNILTSSWAHLAPETSHWSGPRYRWLGLGSSHFSQWLLVTNIWQRYSNCNDEKINLEKYSELYLVLLPSQHKSLWRCTHYCWPYPCFTHSFSVMKSK